MCEKAYRILVDVACDTSLEIDIVDITHPHNRKIRENYINRIPVVKKFDSEDELEWPFTFEAITSYLQGSSQL